MVNISRGSDNPVLIWNPSREPLKELHHLIAVRVKQMRSVQVNKERSCRVQLIAQVSSDVATGFPDPDPMAFFGFHTSERYTSDPSSNYIVDHRVNP
jgi:hypothetical protein